MIVRVDILIEAILIKYDKNESDIRYIFTLIRIDYPL